MKDLIIDCFAGGGGASVGIEMALGCQANIAINHDPAAILMHKTNHPDTLHITEDIFKVDILKYTKGRHVSLMWASPDCTSHSKAKGGQPREKGLRILPWAVHRMAKQVTPDVIIMENVEEIRHWGPLNKKGFPIKAKRGKDYKKFLKMMYLAGYTTIQTRELVAADYGAPTTRKRWYAIFRRDGKEIRWPKPTHSREQWEPVSKCIDFTNLGSSIFTRKTPLKEKTMNRIARGIEKFIINDPNPYFLQDNIASSFLIQYHSETTRNGVRGQSLNEPIQTIDTSNRYGLVTAFITKFYKTGIGQPVTDPLHTITTSPGHFGLVSAFLIKYYGQGIGQSVNEPIGTIVTKDRFGLVTVMIKGEPYQIVDIYMRMLQPEELKLAQGFPADYIIDHDYSGKPYPKKEQVARIGNSVVPIMAKALVETNCSYLKIGERMPNATIDTTSPQLRFA